MDYMQSIVKYSYKDAILRKIQLRYTGISLDTSIIEFQFRRKPLDDVT
jgi:hypothetical protein